MSSRIVVEPQKNVKGYALRDKVGQFSKEQTAVGKSLALDHRHEAKIIVSKGQRDRGDERKS
jgi:hypothetical protein